MIQEKIEKRSQWSLAVKLTLAGLLVAALGIVIQILSGVSYPPIPPGMVILLVPALFIVFAPWWWRVIPGAVVSGFLLLGLFVSGQAGRLVDFNNLGGSIGLWVQLVAMVVGLVAGAAATFRER